MTHQTELGLNLAIARCEMGRMERNAPASLEAATRDIEALERLYDVLSNAPTPVGAPHDAELLGATSEMASQLLEVARFRQLMLRHRDVLDTRVERYLGE